MSRRTTTKTRQLTVDDRAVIDRIQAEHHAGRSTTAIAQGLTRDAIPTARGGRWDHKTIQGILRRTAQNKHAADPSQEVMLDLDTICPDASAQARVALNHATIEEYAEAMAEGATFPPVVVFGDRETYWMGDGFHRYHAARKVGVQHIRAEVRQAPSETRSSMPARPIRPTASDGRMRTSGKPF
jgi:uncharacterized ParB-like nuclease family protein